MNKNPPNYTPLILAGFGTVVVIVLLLLGWRITRVNIPIGSSSIEMEAPAQSQVDSQQPEPTPSPTAASAPVTESNQAAQTLPEIQDFNPPVSLPFSDNFDVGPDAAWRISGNYLVSSGRLAGSDMVKLEIGNNSLSTYMVEFDIFSPTDFCGWSYEDYLIIGVTPTLQYRAAFTDEYSRGRWYALQDGEWKEILRDDIGLSTGMNRSDCSSNVRVLVNGNSYKIYSNGSLVIELIYGTSTGAPFMIGTNKLPQIDNLRITQP
jgi:hypothetical protein